jgi:hypothetical protein
MSGHPAVQAALRNHHFEDAKAILDALGWEGRYEQLRRVQCQAAEALGIAVYGFCNTTEGAPAGTTFWAPGRQAGHTHPIRDIYPLSLFRPLGFSIASDWVEDEVTKALAEERQRGGMVLFPARLDDAVFVTREAWALKLRDNRHIGDFHAWTDHDAYQCTLERLLRDLRVETPDAAPG